jgi:hypothetical protein
MFQETASEMKRQRGGDIEKVDSVSCGAEWNQAAPCSFEGYLQYVADLYVTVIRFMFALHLTLVFVMPVIFSAQFTTCNVCLKLLSLSTRAFNKLEQT